MARPLAEGNIGRDDVRSVLSTYGRETPLSVTSILQLSGKADAPNASRLHRIVADLVESGEAMRVEDGADGRARYTLKKPSKEAPEVRHRERAPQPKEKSAMASALEDAGVRSFADLMDPTPPAPPPPEPAPEPAPPPPAPLPLEPAPIPVRAPDLPFDSKDVVRRGMGAALEIFADLLVKEVSTRVIGALGARVEQQVREAVRALPAPVDLRPELKALEDRLYAAFGGPAPAPAPEPPPPEPAPAPPAQPSVEEVAAAAQGLGLKQQTPKPRVLLVGVFNGQSEMLHREYDQDLRLTVLDGRRDNVAQIARNAEHIFVMEHASHALRQLSGVKFEKISGGMTSVRNKLDQLLPRA